MPRIRSIKPEFWGHPVMGMAEDSVKCLALALLNLADDEGYFLADPRLVRSFARPFDEDSTNVRRALERLQKMGWIEVRNHPSHGEIGLIVNFLEHQKIDRPSPSKIKAYFLDESSTNPRRPLDIGTGNREQGISEQPPPSESPATPPRKQVKKPPVPSDSLPEILGKGRVDGGDHWPGYWQLSAAWPETSNIRKKDSARAYVKARRDASHDCILSWAEWTVKQANGHITTLAAWLENQDWSGREAQWTREPVSA